MGDIVEHRFAPNVRDLGGDRWQIDFAAGEFRSAVAEFVLAAAGEDALAMQCAIERIHAVIGVRGVSTVQLLDAFMRCFCSIQAGGHAQMRAEMLAAAALVADAHAAPDAHEVRQDDADREP